MLGSYEPAPGVSTDLPFARCADDERKDEHGPLANSSRPNCFALSLYEPGPGVSSPMMSSFISRAEDAPKPPEPALFDLPKDLADIADRL